ncbi:biopolymer transporter ExbD [Oceaniovalibus sp. ACAM 378]|uniref:ExbD/TolR family protein n=1 Tax=Oceaniovalibus sp. ACAM 378 TaxID=2599923 RepID=UPI0021038D6E|nr:biopolymer transporter ExbD [Oceaniovalibus sp. ACAM 378]
MTSLIDVIFLLLLFFMLSSTFSKFAEVELAGVGTQGTGSTDQTLFLQVTPDALRLNAAPVEIEALSANLTEIRGQDDSRLLLSLSGDVTSQRLTDVLVILRAQPNLTLRVLALK